MSKDRPRLLARRLTGGSDLRFAIENWCKDEHIEAAVPLSLVGSLSVAAIRFAGESEPVVLEGPFEIVASTGTIGLDGVHIHLSLADSKGTIIGGHLSKGSVINTTVELTAIDFSQAYRFCRVIDPTTGLLELDCKEKIEN